VAGFGIGRLFVLGFGILIALSGLAGIVVGGGSSATAAGVWGVVVGVTFMVAALVERARYRSDTADGTGDQSGHAGGEPAGLGLDARFRPTGERFEDPTTRQRMRVWLDAQSGERRYVPED